jgi:hypothetical protein
MTRSLYHVLVLLVLLMLLLVAFADQAVVYERNFNSSTVESGAKKYTWDAGVSPRLQWITNEGYCGEVSTISAGLKYGIKCLKIKNHSQLKANYLTNRHPRSVLFSIRRQRDKRNKLCDTTNGQFLPRWNK